MSDKRHPLVSVAMSIFSPDLDMLAIQIDSIAAQDYPALELVVYNDNPASEDLSDFICGHAGVVPVRYLAGKDNLGYVKAFEFLVGECKGDYIALCDQDDEWLPNRVSACMDLLESGCTLVCCDRSIIDGEGALRVESWRHSHPRELESNWFTGEDITSRAAFRCYAIGMATMVKTSVAQELRPYPACVGHDLWIALGASEVGACGYVDEPLVRYRIHGVNQTGALKGVNSKADWYASRVDASLEVAREFAKRFPESPYAPEIIQFAEARVRKSVLGMFRQRKLSPQVALFEIALRFMPDAVFKRIVARF